MERRTYKQPISLRNTEGDAAKPEINGYSAVYYDPTNPATEYVMQIGSWTVRERIAQGAFDGIMNDDAYCLFNHDPNQVLGNTTARTCTLSLDARGLAFVCQLPNTTLGNDVRQLIARQDIRGCSFAFDIAEDAWVEDSEARVLVREIRRIKRLYDVGPVTYPAYGGTTVQSRSSDPDPTIQRKLQELEAKSQRIEERASGIRQRLIEQGLQRLV